MLQCSLSVVGYLSFFLIVVYFSHVKGSLPQTKIDTDNPNVSVLLHNKMFYKIKGT